MILVDTSHLTALLVPRDSLHHRAKNWNTQLEKQSILVTEYVLWEALNSASHPAIRQKAHVLLHELRMDSRATILPASPELWEAGLRLHEQHADQEWSLTDCISFHIMRARRMTRALTYDHHFEQAGFDALLRRDPPALNNGSNS